MVGIVIVSHSEKLADGVVELVKMMSPNCLIAASGGLSDGGLGTDYNKINDAINNIYNEDGLLIIMDMGSAIMTTEMAIEFNSDKKLVMVDCPIVEGAVIASISACQNKSLEAIIDEIKTQSFKKILD